MQEFTDAVTRVLSDAGGIENALKQLNATARQNAGSLKQNQLAPSPSSEATVSRLSYFPTKASSSHNSLHQTHPATSIKIREALYGELHQLKLDRQLDLNPSEHPLSYHLVDHHRLCRYNFVTDINQYYKGWQIFLDNPNATIVVSSSTVRRALLDKKHSTIFIYKLFLIIS